MTEAEKWAGNYLLAHNYTLKSNMPEEVQMTPWSHVVRFATTDGYIYLKQTPLLIALEAKIIEMLRNQFDISVPQIIAYHPELNCFLMKDAGRPLRETLKKQFDVVLVYRAVKQFTSMQLAICDHVDKFIDIGVPDWRLDKMPILYEQFVSQETVFLENGLLENDISQLKILVPKIYSLCKKLSGFGIKQTIVQPDFNDNNTLLDDKSQRMTIIDLGEIVVSHPFFSLINFLFQMKKHHALEEENILDACLENYKEFGSKEFLLEALAIAKILWPVYGVLAYDRLMLACGADKVLSFHSAHEDRKSVV